MATTTKPTTDQKHVSELVKKIAKLTGREPVSREARYLEQRLASIEKRKANGEDVRRKPAGTSVVSASMPIEAATAFEKLMEREKCGASALIVKALAYYALGNGYKSEAAALGAGAEA